MLELERLSGAPAGSTTSHLEAWGERACAPGLRRPLAHRVSELGLATEAPRISVAIRHATNTRRSGMVASWYD